MHIIGMQNQEITISPNLRTTLNGLLKFLLIYAILSVVIEDIVWVLRYQMILFYTNHGTTPCH
jgi:hypothetical protein